jgi:TonB family protein
MRGSFAWIVFLCWLAPLAARAQDRDGDRLLDDLDLCPDAAEGPATLFPGDGCPDVDTDGDRIVDDHDVCPAEPETVNGFEDADGCADAEEVSLEELVDRLPFAAGSHELDYAALLALGPVASWLEAHPAAHLQIVGRSDGRGSAAQDDLLSMRRATAVRQGLVERGIESSRLTARALGTLPGDTHWLQARDRRVEVHVALDGAGRDSVDLSRFSGVHLGDAFVDLRIGSNARDTTATLHPMERGWRLTAYGARVIGDRLVLVLRGGGREVLVTLRVRGDRADGFIEVRSAGAVRRHAWTARHEPFFGHGMVVHAISRSRSEIQRCYELELQEEQTLTGRVAVTMTVLESGEVEGVRIVEDTLTPPRAALGACVVRVVDAFEFHPGPCGGSVSYTFPFVFEPQVE